ncbi:glycosyltransferase family 2 protein [Candidatus Roizmanbacteria bacterium]|nr:glycosyltransferase family 2 protein [Candidatus Roizmanbacteria bacterium]
MKQPNLSIIVLAKNEEKRIAACIRSVSFAEEVIVIDDNSADATVAIAQKEGAIVYTHALSDFASQRNRALTLARGKWILFVDADEWISDELRTEIQAIIGAKKSIL